MLPDSSTTGVLLLHGWGTSPQRLEPMRRALSAGGFDAQHWPYEARGSVRAIGADLALAVRDRPVHLVGHSLGGLVSASAVLDHGAPALSVTTVNTPWRGTWAAWTADRDDPLGQQLRWGSDELARLRGGLAHHLAGGEGPPWRVLSALGDLAAPPTGALRVPRGERLDTDLVGVRGHSISLLHPRMIEAVLSGLLPS
jgi:alpha-beta hydrolase superfamily lysophospholipase